MSENLRMWIEIIFNVVYLILIWILVFKMFKGQYALNSKTGLVESCFIWAFGLLALGDSGHVGFRVIAYLAGGLEEHRILVGIGAFMTAVTVTFFYILLLAAWKYRYNKSYNLFAYLLLAAAVLRLAIMLFPANGWGSLVPPFEWSLYRNLPLMLQGLGAAGLILYDSIKANDRTFMWIGAMILISYACYMPVIFLVQKLPMVGMLMIPKTLAYLAAGFIAYYGLFKTR